MQPSSHRPNHKALLAGPGFSNLLDEVAARSCTAGFIQRFDVRGGQLRYGRRQTNVNGGLSPSDESVRYSCKRVWQRANPHAVFMALCVFLLPAGLRSQTLSTRITAQIDNAQRATIAGTHPVAARSQNDAGRVPSATKLQGITLVFSRTAAQEANLQALIIAQQNPSSSLYHQWLTPDEYAARFGMSDEDIATTESWLQQQGFSIDSVARSKSRITFSGTAGQAEDAFGMELHYYKSGSMTNCALSTDITIPAALSSVVQTVSNLSSFRPKPRVKFKPGQRTSTANFTSRQSGDHYLTPKDVATIYDIDAAYNASYTGTGQSIAIVGQSAVVLSDIENFQTAAGLTVKDPTVVLVPSSGTSATSTGDEAESDIDLEYSGGIGNGATIYFVYVGNDQNYSVWDSIEYAVDTMIAPIISTSYGECETAMSASNG